MRLHRCLAVLAHLNFGCLFSTLDLPKGLDNVHFGLKLEFTSIYENFEKFLENGWLSSWRRSNSEMFGTFESQVDWWKTWEHSLQIEMLRNLENLEFLTTTKSEMHRRKAQNFIFARRQKLKNSKGKVTYERCWRCWSHERRDQQRPLKACANSDLQTVNAQDTPMPPPRKWMMPVALSMVMLSAFGWIEGTTWKAQDTPSQRW